ncbi:MASE1 domain-containing protein [Streptomyces sp. NPDC051320]|uniref:MASE1 domain-containing protein n=1 Tax=Streptomyces sp. NPDC051320 TaxID=3154644 RepID=UPI003417DDE7
MIRSEAARRRTATALRVLAVAAAYYVSGQLGLERQVTVHGSMVTPLWPPTGVALAALLCWGLRVWPGIALGALFVTAATGDSFSGDGIVIALGNTLAPLGACYLLRRADFRIQLDRLRDGLALVFLGALPGMLVSSTVGSVVLLADDKLPRSGFWLVWFAWWAGDTMGVLVVTPLLLVLSRARLPQLTGRSVEAGALAVAALVVSPLATRSHLAMLFLVFPLLIWAALRFELAGSAPCALLVAVLAVVAATDRVGAFAHLTLLEVMINLTTLNGSVALTSLLLSAIVTEHKNIRRRLERACEELADVVEHLSLGGRGTGWLPPEAPGEGR